MKKKSLYPSINIEEPPNQFLSKKNCSLTVLGSILTFTCFFTFFNHQGYLALPNVKIQFISSRVISIIHATLSSCAAWFYLRKKITFKTWTILIGISAGYFFFDFSREILGEKHSLLTALAEVYGHHACVLLILLFYLYKRPKLIAKGMLGEITNIPLNVTWYLKQSNQLDTLFGKVISLLVLVSFAITRIYNLTYIWYQLYCEKGERLEFAFFTPIVLLSYYWFIRLLIIGYKVFFA